MKIVLTGGPSAGKTTIGEVLARTYKQKLSLVPEAASILFRGGFPRLQDHYSVKCQQNAIYHVQKNLERVAAAEEGKVLICDRGSLDGLAYWPGTAAEFFKSIESDMDKELARYDWVIHLDTSELLSYLPTSMRIEDYKSACDMNNKVREAWSLHPRRFIVENHTDFNSKVKLTSMLVQWILSGRSYSEIIQLCELNKPHEETLRVEND